MPVRMVDGEGLWGSEKLSKVHPDVRAEYANWIPLAEANGVFELDTKKIWSRIYSYNRDEIPVEFVDFVINEFIRVGLLVTWTEGGRKYGFWTGIDKKNRLPSVYHRGKFRNLPPNPPESLLNQEVSLSSIDDLEMVERQRVDPVPNHTLPIPYQNQTLADDGEIEMASLKKKIQNIVRADVSDFLVKKFNDKYWEGDKLDALREYVQSHPDSENPLSEFLGIRAESVVAVAVKGIIQREDVKRLGVKIFTITDIQMSQKQMSGAAALLDLYTEEEIIRAFNWAYNKSTDDFSRNQSVNKFFTGFGEAVILSLREQLARQEAAFKKADQLVTAPLISAQEAEEEEEQGLSPEDF